MVEVIISTMDIKTRRAAMSAEEMFQEVEKKGLGLDKEVIMMIINVVISVIRIIQWFCEKK